MNMPLAGIEAIFSSTDLHVKKWRCLVPSVAQLGPCAIPELEERRKILSSHLVPLVRFSHMTCEALQEIFTCTDADIDHEQSLSLGYLCAKLIQHTNQARCSCSMCNLLFVICRASLQVQASESGSVWDRNEMEAVVLTPMLETIWWYDCYQMQLGLCVHLLAFVSACSVIG